MIQRNEMIFFLHFTYDGRTKMAEFFMNKEPHTDGTHTLHRNDCQELPAFETLEYLGSYSNVEAARVKADGLQFGVALCGSCLSH